MKKQTDFLFAKCEKKFREISVTEILRFLYKCIKNIDFLANKDKI